MEYGLLGVFTTAEYTVKTKLRERYALKLEDETCLSETGAGIQKCVATQNVGQ